ncbi:hypothetical protein HG535_0H03140 [Zygotorulaspora mrakii]|uniref:Micro-fibrillar-associated protein 1 C-terminal domain-containing protein n=1 Tax=Zygotorulaspora mrakii TaxID=42260 RepID=A0A7H9B8P7_ZYGMR|nr:uncharacterized protein HG535_0H03140 [Zygotorulaspora mrakii]QLG74987.1 hypothetical protein HG535_0H03140 [Zygotorulaspora mrakii]
MAVRHFRRVLDNNEENSDLKSSSDEDSESDVPQQPTAGVVADTKGIDQQRSEDIHGKEEDSGTESSDSTSSTSSDSSHEDQIIALHKPVFIKKSRIAKRPNEDEVQQSLEEREMKKRASRMQKVKHENDILTLQEESKRQMNMNYSTDKDLLIRAMLLDDSDVIDPTREEMKWLERQEARRKRRRDRLLAKQLELEEYEANKLKFSKMGDAGVSERAPKPTIKAVSQSANQYKPNRVQDITFAKLNDREGGNEDTEYSVL